MPRMYVCIKLLSMHVATNVIILAHTTNKQMCDLIENVSESLHLLSAIGDFIFVLSCNKKESVEKIVGFRFGNRSTNR